MYRHVKGSLLFISISIVLSIAFAGCSKRESSSSLVIAVSQCSQDIWRDKLNAELQLEAYFHDNVKLLFECANDDDARQVEQINAFIDHGIDLLIVSPNQLATITPAIDRAYDSGIPVIVFDRKTSSQKFTAYIGADNREIGRVAGKYVGERLAGHGRVLEIMGLKGSSPAIERHEGFVEALREYPGITLVASLEGDWTGESAVEAVKAARDTLGHIDYVFGQNDRMALGARSVLGSGTLYCGVDGLAGKGGGIEAVRAGELEMSCIYPTHGDEVLQLALAIVEGRPYKHETLLTTAPVTAHNADALTMQYIEQQRQANYLKRLQAQTSETLKSLRASRFSLMAMVLIAGLLAAVAMLAVAAWRQKHKYNKQLQATLDERERLTAEVDRLHKSHFDFYTNISHELRTPLSLIVDPIDRLSRSQGLDAEQRELVEVAARSAASLRQLVDEILALRHLQDEDAELHLSRFDLPAMFRNWVKYINAGTNSHGISLSLAVVMPTATEAQHTETPAGEAADIVADYEKLGLMLNAIFANALQARVRGVIEVKLTRLTSPCRWSITMLNKSGTPVYADEKRLFERDFLSDKYTGATGVKIATLAQVVRLHGGTISHTVGDDGHTLEIVLPCRAEASAPTADTSSMPVPELPSALSDVPDAATVVHDDRPTVLVVDDNDDVRTYVARFLSSSYNVVEAEDGEHALALAREIVPDVVVSDVMMPKMNGNELCAALKADLVTSHIPVLLLTARAAEAQQVEGWTSGADAFVAKPFSTVVLQAQVASLLRNRVLLKQVARPVEALPQQPADEATGSEPKPVPPVKEQQFLNRVMAAINERLGDSQLGVEDIAAAVGLSRVQLYRKVKAITGSSMNELVRATRLERARELLAAGDMTVTQVAYEVGFSSPSYFTKCYKDHFGMPPTGADARADH